MAATLETRETLNGLSFRVNEPRHTSRIILLSAIGIAFLFLLTRGTETVYMKVLIGAFIAFVLIRSLISSIRGTEVELTVTNLDFKTFGHSPKDGYKSAIVSRADIQYMGFRKSYGGGEDTEYPSGLYVECSGTFFGAATCLVPDIDEVQPNQVMEAIYNRFPDTGTLTPVGPSEPYLISLNLNKP